MNPATQLASFFSFLLFSFFFSFLLLILLGTPWAVPLLLKLSVNNLTDNPVERCVPYVIRSHPVDNKE